MKDSATLDALLLPVVLLVSLVLQSRPHLRLPTAPRVLAMSLAALLAILASAPDAPRQTAQTTVFRTSRGNTRPLELGRIGAQSGMYLRGKLDDLRLWSVVRSATELAASYREQLKGTAAFSNDVHP